MLEILAVLSNMFTLTFVVASMLALGFSLTVRQIVSPLSDVQLVLRALVANFVRVPAAAYAIKTLIPIDGAAAAARAAHRHACGPGHPPERAPRDCGPCPGAQAPCGPMHALRRPQPR